MAGVKIIAETCIRSDTVKRLIYTASVMAASPLKSDASGYKDVVNETCWTPLNLPYQMYSVCTYNLKLINCWGYALAPPINLFFSFF